MSAHQPTVTRARWIDDAAKHLEKAAGGYELTKDQEIACATTAEILALASAIIDAADTMDRAFRSRPVV